MASIETANWLALLHQLPTKPPYLRVKVWRRLQTIGAVPLKNAVHVLPKSDANEATLRVLLEEIVVAGGDAILLDAPCTASGIVRRHPDIRWLRRHADIDQLATTAAAILDALWRVLGPDGTMLFATCSVFVQEGETQLRQFLARHPDAVRLEAPGQLLPTNTDALDHDGFFYARVAKRMQR